MARGWVSRRGERDYARRDVRLQTPLLSTIEGLHGAAGRRWHCGKRANARAAASGRAGGRAGNGAASAGRTGSMSWRKGDGGRETSALRNAGSGGTWARRRRRCEPKIRCPHGAASLAEATVKCAAPALDAGLALHNAHRRRSPPSNSRHSPADIVASFCSRPLCCACLPCRYDLPAALPPTRLGLEVAMPHRRH